MLSIHRRLIASLTLAMTHPLPPPQGRGKRRCDFSRTPCVIASEHNVRAWQSTVREAKIMGILCLLIASLTLAMTQDYRFCIIVVQANNMRAWQSNTSNIHGQPIDSLAMTFGILHNTTQLPTKTLMSHNATMARSKAAIISAIFMLFACIIDT